MLQLKLRIKCGVLELKNSYKTFVFSLCLSLLFFSCESIPPRGSLAGANVIGENSDVFIFVPVQSNKELLTKVLPPHKYLKKALDKTDYLYLSLALKDLPKIDASPSFLEENNNETIEGEKGSDESVSDKGKNIQDVLEGASSLNVLSEENEMTIEENEKQNIFDLISYNLCAIGNYPAKLARFFLTKKNGWIRKRKDDGYSYYQREDDEAKSFSFFSIPTKEIALFSHNTDYEDKMEEFLERVDRPRPVYFDEDFEMAIQQGNPSNDICIFVANSHFFLSKLLGINLDLPIESLKVYLGRDTSRSKEIYTYSIIIEAKNLTAGFATRLLLSKLLKTQVRVNGNKIVVEKAKVTSERLVELIQKTIGNL